MNLNLKTCLCLCTLLLVAALPAAADLTIVSKVTSDQGTTTSTSYISESKYRRSDAESDVIFEIDTGRIINIDHKKKKYSIITLQQLEAKMNELSAMLKDNPMVGQMLGDLTASAEVQKVGETRTIAGYECVLYRLTVGKNISVDMWVAPALRPPMNYYDARKMVYAQMGPMAGQFEKMIDEMKKVEGYSLASTTETRLMGRNMTVKEEATEVKEGSLPAGTFDIPAGYKQGKSPFE